MNGEAIIELNVPQLPYYLGAGRSEYEIGDHHPNRKNLGIYDLLIVVKGELYIGENNQQWTLKKGETLLLLPEGEHFSNGPCTEKTVFYWLHFEHAARYESFPTSGNHEPEVQDSSRPFGNSYTLSLPKHSKLADPQAAFNLLEQLLSLQIEHSFWHEQRLLGELLSMLEEGSLRVMDSVQTRLAEQASNYIQQNYKTKVTNETLAAALHFHPNYVIRCMKMKYGKTPIEYLNELRLERAKRLLVTTDWQIDRIAEEVGFRYAPYFSSCFKRYIGLSPLQFRKQYMAK
ncbi:AraC family transcriptional regulator [Paenibacillus sp. F6_3S_P_1C]|uniref:AraC family transcriptional regulator n=1 Tax=Paenibacillus vandeheii TaxID=3035917 RepID=A0ABT8JBP3_9BACL|nr:AraC family transcriptional regulator [Paenibacillus vandeheii]MDN4602338.1 AraC family transcriptional regulator [Paenibacillus vandeheii]